MSESVSWLKPIILNVNDTDANRYVLSRSLQRAGFEVQEARTGTEALEKAAANAHEIDLILLDVNLPDLSGHEVCRRLKADPATAFIPVLQISASATASEEKVAGLESGADAYLSQDVQPQELVATVHALLRLKRAEQAVRESEEQYRSLAESIPQIAWTAGPAGDITFFSQRWYDYTGLSREESERAGWDSAMNPEDRAPNAVLWEAAVEEGNSYENAVRLRRYADNTYRWHLGRALPVRDRAGRVVKWFGTFTDIDEQERARLDLLSGEQRKNDFMAMLGHELRNPLGPLTNATRILREHEPDDAVVQRQTSVIERQVRHMTRLVEDLLDVARIARGRFETRLEPVDLNEIVQHAVETCQLDILERFQELTVLFADSPLFVRGDPARLRQVVVNLLQNAAKYTPRHGHIEVSTGSEARAGVIRVRDDGEGILPDMLPLVFNLFAQADRSLDRSQGGLGLGLTLVKDIVERHGGSVEANSQGAEEGSEFVVRIPLIEAPSALDLPEPATTAGTDPLKVLVVEDNQDGAETLLELLEIWGHTARAVSDGPAALQMAAQYDPDVILMDIGLPGMSGYEVCERLRQDRQFDETLLVALTGYGREEDRQRSEQAGFDLHLTKPIEPETLQKMLQRQSKPPNGPKSS